MIISDLKERVFSAVDIRPDRRFRHWVKWVDSIDPAGKDGYAFKGDFVEKGTIELVLTRPRLALAAAETGSVKNHEYEYGFAVVHPDGTVQDTGIRTGGSPGWALRLRDAAVVALNHLNNVADPALLSVTVEIVAESLTAFRVIKEKVTTTLSYEDIVRLALVRLADELTLTQLAEEAEEENPL